ncbi:MMPL family transporter [Nonomuraea sp. WAC 01424]|uniref:MMPL family transporter n=1 Tax=Nonomuraea sp. WAC 01424 TaxID=2203200 RepID=UPI000F788190|nr:MMPL family transporter [Nonomuraea sp. WAC 01424]
MWGNSPLPGRTRRLRQQAVLWGALATFAVALVAGMDVHERLVLGDIVPLGSSSVRADDLLRNGFHAGNANLVLIARATRPVDAPEIDAAGKRLTERVSADPGVWQVTSYWRDHAPRLRGRDGHAGVVLAHLSGDNAARNAAARRIVQSLNGRYGPLALSATGEAQVRVEAQDRSEADLRTAELIAAPLTLAILCLVFGSVVAALLPVLIGPLAVVATMAVLRLLTEVMEISVFALSISSALGFALAVDFSLFIVTRFREHLAEDGDASRAIAVTMRTTGRAMACSAATVALSMSALLLFPFTMLRSLAVGGMTISLMAAAASLLVLPAVLTLLGDRVNRLPVPGPWSARRRAAPPVEDGPWYRLAIAVMRRPVVVAVPATALLLAMGVPFLGARFGTLDDRVLPPDAPAAVAARSLRADFGGQQVVGGTLIVLPDLPPTAQDAAGRLDAYARRLSATAGVLRVDTAGGSYSGAGVVPREGRRFTGEAGTWLLVTTAHEPFSVANSELVQRLRAITAPGRAFFGGPGAELDDVRQNIAGTLPLALTLIALTTLAMVALLTRSVVLAVKALVMNVLSLTATFGALVHVFQDGHLGWLVGDFTATGSIDALMPTLIFCVAFGLSMDYEIFLLSRITEEYRRGGDTVTAVATGLQHTGRLFTSAAVIFAVVMAAVATSGLAVLKMIGVGIAVAVLVDCTLIRTLLVPAVMRLAGPANWWAPRPLHHGRRGGDGSSGAAPRVPVGAGAGGSDGTDTPPPPP